MVNDKGEITVALGYVGGSAALSDSYKGRYVSAQLNHPHRIPQFELQTLECIFLCRWVVVRAARLLHVSDAEIICVSAQAAPCLSCY